MAFRFPQVRLEVDFGARSSIGEISLISIGYGLHQAWIYGSMYDNGSIFDIAPSASGFFNEAISLTYMISILVYGLILLVAAEFDRQFLRLVYKPGAVALSGLLCSVGTFLLLVGVDIPQASIAVEAASGVLTGIGSATLLLAWGVAFSRRDTSTIAINGALAIIIGFTVYSCILHALPYPFGGIVSGLIPLVEVLILLALQRTHAITELNSPMNVGLPINTGKFALIFGLPVLFLGFALGIMRQFSISTVLTGSSSSDQSFIFMTACFATIFLLMVFLGPERESGYSSFFRPMIPFIAITVLFIPFAADSYSPIATGILLMGYMIFEAMMWVFFGQLSQQFRLSPVLVFGLGRGIMSMSSLGGSLLPIAGNSFVTSTTFGSGIVILILIVFMMFAFSLLPSEKTILSLTTFSRSTEDAIRAIDASIAQEDGGFVDKPDTLESPHYVEMGNEVRHDLNTFKHEQHRPDELMKEPPAERNQTAAAEGTDMTKDSYKANTDRSKIRDANHEERLKQAFQASQTDQTAHKNQAGQEGYTDRLEIQASRASQAAHVPQMPNTEQSPTPASGKQDMYAGEVDAAQPSEARRAMEESARRARHDDPDDGQFHRSGAFRQRCENVANTFLLSKREAEVMFYLARGYKSSNIQEILYISEGTAKTHIRHIYRKLDVHSQGELMKLVNSVELDQ